MDSKVKNIRYKSSDIRPTHKASMISPYNPEETVLEPYLTTTPYPTTTPYQTTTPYPTTTIRPLINNNSNSNTSTISIF